MPASTDYSEWSNSVQNLKKYVDMYTAIQQYFFLVSLPEYLPLTALQQYKTLQHKWPKSQEDRFVTFGFILFGFWNTAWCKYIWITNVKEQNTFLAEQISADNFFL